MGGSSTEITQNNLLQAEMDLLNFAGIQDNEVQIKDTQLLDDP